MPDSSIMLELCNILDVTVNELLSGERIEVNNYEERADENLIELKRKDENNMNKNAIISTLYTIAMVIGIGVCCICDIAISGSMTWSLIVLSSVLVTWIASVPIILILSILVYTFFSRMFDLMLPPVVKHSIAVA